MNLRENMTIASLDMVSSRTFINQKKEKRISGEFYEKLSVKANGIEDNIMNLSGGNQQKIVLSKWLMKHIKVLILDEPTRAWTWVPKWKFIMLLRNLRREELQ